MIEKARSERDARLKQAAMEADAEIAKFKAEKEAVYNAEVTKFDSTAGSTSLKIRDDADREMNAVKYNAVKNKPAVVDMLFKYVTNVDVEL